MKTVKVVAFALVAGLAMSAAAEPKYRATLTATGYTGETTLTNFPVLVRISPRTISDFHYSQCATNGADVSFKSAGQTLAHEIDTWNTNGESTVWVNLPTLAKDTTFVMRWGDSDVTSTTSTNATWNVDYVGVWHMGEPGSGTTCANSTSKGSKYDAKPAGTTANSKFYDGTDAPIGGARTTGVKPTGNNRNDGKSYLLVDDYESDEKVGSVFTVSGWVRMSGLWPESYYPRLFSKKQQCTDLNGWEIEMSNKYDVFGAHGAEWHNLSQGPLPSLSNSWVHVAFVFSNATLRVYGNGNKVTTDHVFVNQNWAVTNTVSNCEIITAATANTVKFAIGCNPSAIQEFIYGAFDECRLMKGAASADWVKAEYDTVKTPGFLTYGKAVCGFMLFIR